MEKDLVSKTQNKLKSEKNLCEYNLFFGLAELLDLGM